LNDENETFQVIHPYHPLSGKVFVVVAAIQTAVLIYLGYWIWQVWRKEK